MNSYEEDFRALKTILRDIKQDITNLQIRCDKIEGRLRKLEEK